jgi:hypothetical protein
LEGKFSENNRMLQDVLGILDMRVAFELTATEAAMQLQRVVSGDDGCTLHPFSHYLCTSTSCKTPFFANVEDNDENGDATCPAAMPSSGPYQTQLDAAGFKRQRIVQLMDGQASTSVIQAPLLPSEVLVPKLYACANCGKRFQSSQGLGAHTKNCVQKSSARGHNLLSTYFHRSPDDAVSSFCIETQVPAPSPTAAPTDSPTTSSITSPTQALTQAPTVPTQAPTQSPTNAPTVDLRVRVARSSGGKVRLARSYGFKLRVIQAFEVCRGNSNIAAPATVVADMFGIHVSMVAR